MHTFVTSFLDLNNEEKRLEHKKSTFYIEKGSQLLAYPYNFIVFIDDHSKKILLDIIGEKSNITYYTINLNELPVSNILTKNEVLPQTATNGKDTFNYLSIMISKTFFVDIATQLNPYNSSHFSWIDLGILHIINNDYLLSFSESINKINEYRGNKIRIPGCYDPFVYAGKQLIEYKESPCWAFCGGFFSGDLENLRIFSKLVIDCLQNMKEQNFITWEINIWAYIYCRYPNLFDWYYGDHNILMLSNF